MNGEATGRMEPQDPGPTPAKPAVAAAREERRRTRRVRIRLAARLKPYYQCSHLPPEVRPTIDISRDGIYFTTPRDTYNIGMHLMVTCPHTEACTGAGADAGDLARVVRVEMRDGKEWGVALHFVRSIGYHRNSAGPSVI